MLHLAIIYNPLTWILPCRCIYYTGTQKSYYFAIFLSFC